MGEVCVTQRYAAPRKARSSTVVSDCMKMLMSTTSQLEPTWTRPTSQNLDSAGLLVKMGRELSVSFHPFDDDGLPSPSHMPR
jgi:hypothetical protein